MRTYFASLLPVVTAIIVAISSSANAECLKINASQTSYTNLSQGMLFYEDIEKSLTVNPDEALPDVLKAVSLFPSRSIAQLSGYHDRRVWSSICLDTPQNVAGRYILQYTYPSMQVIDVRLYDRTRRLVNRQVSGKTIPFKDRGLKDTDYLFEWDLKAGEQYTAIMMFASTSSMQFPISLMTAKEAYEKVESKYMALGIYYGLIFLILTFSLLLFIALRGSLYLSYFAYVASVAMAQMSLQGVAFRFLWPDAMAWNRVSTIFFVNVMFLALSYFTSISLEVPDRFKKLRWVLRAFAVAAASLAASSIIAYGTEVVRLTGILTSILPLVVLPVGFAAWRSGVEFAPFYVSAVASYILGASAYGLKDAGVIAPNFFTENGILLGSVIEILVFTLGIVYKMKTVSQDAELMRTELNVASALSDLASQVSHDIRSPLAALNSSVFALERSPAEAKDVIRLSIKRINAIADDLLRYRRGTRMPSVYLAGLSLGPLLESLIVEKKSEFAANSQIDIELDKNPSFEVRVGFPELEFGRILSNLINNAVESGAGKVKVFARQHHEEVSVAIVDDGRGIPEEVMSRIGEKGFSTKHSGSGLGLWHAKASLAKFGGNLTVQSKAGIGSMITIRMPVLTGEQPGRSISRGIHAKLRKQAKGSDTSVEAQMR